MRNFQPFVSRGRGNWIKREEAVSSINGHMIRPVRTGDRALYTVDGTGHRFETQDAAELYANLFMIPKHRKAPVGIVCDVCGENGGDDCTGDRA